MVNQISYQSNESSQTECSGMSSHFTSNFIETDNSSRNQISQHYETYFRVFILANQNAQYNPMDTIPQTDSTGLIHSSKCPKAFQPADRLQTQDSSRREAKPYVCNFCSKVFSKHYNLTKHLTEKYFSKFKAVASCKEKTFTNNAISFQTPYRILLINKEAKKVQKYIGHRLVDEIGALLKVFIGILNRVKCIWATSTGNVKRSLALIFYGVACISFSPVRPALCSSRP
ncbi:hypothetical protein CDAR_92671 [Caerostris darwini]|uniref:C2H2-type domain-containing protein n=1 Tax=Caerostris darwini TaxID=1538125 RepID=A0AAV4TS56_9ARAC|nr:hypothetical protein CDAR_92671 [Caerostris darwini]